MTDESNPSARDLIRDAKAGLSRYRKLLFRWAITPLPGDDEEDPNAQISEEQLIKLMATVILAEVDLGTDEEPGHTTQLTQILRLILQQTAGLAERLTKNLTHDMHEGMEGVPKLTLHELELARSSVGDVVTTELRQLSDLAVKAQQILTEQGLE